jgi:hypothetical protein
MEKYPIDPARLRHLPSRFSWLDQRLLTDQHLRRCPRPAQALYLFLALVSDARGLSYYSDPSVRTHLDMPQSELVLARTHLLELGLVAYQKPLYQLLTLDPLKSDSRDRTCQTLSIADLIQIPKKP